MEIRRVFRVTKSLDKGLILMVSMVSSYSGNWKRWETFEQVDLLKRELGDSGTVCFRSQMLGSHVRQEGVCSFENSYLVGCASFRKMKLFRVA